MWPAFAAELAERSGLDTGYRASGALVVAADRDDAEELRRLFAFQQSLGLDVRWLGGRECRRLEPRLSPRVSGGIVAAHDHQVEPRAVVRALREAFVGAGGELRCGVAVSDYSELDAEHVVVAAGCWSGAPVRPVKGQILRLRGDSLASRLIRTPRCYVVSRPNGEVVVGATVEERGFDTTVTADGVFRLLEAAREVLPDVGRARVRGGGRAAASGHARQRAADRRPRRRHLGDRAPPQRRAARADHRRRRGGDGCRRVTAGGRRAVRPGPLCREGHGMRVVLNGEGRDLDDGATVREAVTATGAPSEGRGVAVALDGEVVPRRSWDDVPLREGQRVEVVQAVQGG